MNDAAGYSMTVLMTADAVGGVWQYALGLCAALSDVRFVLAVMGPAPSARQREAAERFPNVTLEMEPYRLEWMQGAAEDLGPSRAWLAMLARLHGADLLHVNGYAHAANRAGLPVLAVAHSDVLSWWRAVHRDEVPSEWEAYRRAVIAGLGAADRLVAPTAAVVDDLSRHYGIAGKAVEVIPNGVDLTRFAPRPKQPVVMAVGRLWDRAKNLQIFDGIADGLAWPIEIAGDASHPDGGSSAAAAPSLPSPASGGGSLEAPSPASGGGSFLIPSPASGGGLGRGQCLRESGSGRICLLGPLSHEEMAERLGAAAIFAAPALYEPFGLAIAEAAACGCALVLADIPSLRENWEGAAVFVPPDNRAAWRSTLSCLIACDERRRMLTEAACRHARNFSRQRMARRYAALYRDLTERRRSRRDVA